MNPPNPYKQTEVEKLAGTVNELLVWVAFGTAFYLLLPCFGVSEKTAFFFAVAWPLIGMALVWLALGFCFVVVLPLVKAFYWCKRKWED